MKYIAPQTGEKAFTCPHCATLSQQKNWWYDTNGGGPHPKPHSSYPIFLSICTHCKGHTLWFENQLIYPDRGNAPAPNSDMPEDVKKDYEEAATIYSKSPRGAGALLRLSLQKLCKNLGGGGENINKDIKLLVGKGLPVQVQQALDSVRVIGNHAVHPGQIDTDDPKVVESLFSLVNIVTDYMISRPKEVAEIYGKLPDGAKQAIEKRDKNA